MAQLGKLWYNSTDHNSTDLSSYEALYSFPSPSILSHGPSIAHFLKVNNHLHVGMSWLPCFKPISVRPEIL